MSEGRLVHGTVDEKRVARKIEKDGPTGLLMTTTAAGIDSEMETRCLSLTTDDSRKQTSSIYAALAKLEGEEECPVHFDSWHELQRWIVEDGETRVVIPYIGVLAAKMPNTATRLRRDFVSMLCLIRTHAILHQETRDRDEHGRIIATVGNYTMDEDGRSVPTGDYTAVRELISELVAEAVDATVSPAIRETVEAVQALLETEPSTSA